MCSRHAEHNFLIESIKAAHVYRWIMIVVNKLTRPCRSHDVNNKSRSLRTETIQSAGIYQQAFSIFGLKKRGKFHIAEKLNNKRSSPPRGQKNPPISHRFIGQAAPLHGICVYSTQKMIFTVIQEEMDDGGGQD